MTTCFHQGFHLFHSMTSRPLDDDRVQRFARLCFLLREMHLMSAVETPFAFVLFAAVRAL